MELTTTWFAEGIFFFFSFLGWRNDVINKVGDVFASVTDEAS